MPEQNEMVRAHVWVRGRVQGVGFRAHVEYYALRFSVRGWVRNVGFDTVEAVAEGERQNVERFVEMMKSGPAGARVDEARVEWEPNRGEFTGFSVVRSL